MTRPKLPTSIVGSLPKPSWLAEPDTLWSPWKLEGEALVEGKQDARARSRSRSSARGIDIVSDGEQTRQHFVTTFIEHLRRRRLRASARRSASATATTRACRPSSVP